MQASEPEIIAVRKIWDRGELWAAGRGYNQTATTTLAPRTRDSYEPVLKLLSGGDCSYPGLFWHDDLL